MLQIVLVFEQFFEKIQARFVIWVGKLCISVIHDN